MMIMVLLQNLRCLFNVTDTAYQTEACQAVTLSFTVRLDGRNGDKAQNGLLYLMSSISKTRLQKEKENLFAR